ncbi:MAG: hypothetical protein E7214_16500 [Clostridium sp.]|nr:hypothetical protein [Clostridium sp.]
MMALGIIVVALTKHSTDTNFENESRVLLDISEGFTLDDPYFDSITGNLTFTVYKSVRKNGTDFDTIEVTGWKIIIKELKSELRSTEVKIFTITALATIILAVFSLIIQNQYYKLQTYHLF